MGELIAAFDDKATAFARMLKHGTHTTAGCRSDLVALGQEMRSYALTTIGEDAKAPREAERTTARNQHGPHRDWHNAETSTPMSRRCARTCARSPAAFPHRGEPHRSDPGPRRVRASLVACSSGSPSSCPRSATTATILPSLSLAEMRLTSLPYRRVRALCREPQTGDAARGRHTGVLTMLSATT